MPEDDAPISKAQAIKQFLAEHPDASPKAVAEALVAQGFQISSVYVSAVQAKLESERQSGDNVNNLLVTLGRAQVDADWEHAFHVYDQACKEAAPESKTADNRRLMHSYLLGKRRKSRKR